MSGMMALIQIMIATGSIVFGGSAAAWVPLPPVAVMGFAPGAGAVELHDAMLLTSLAGGDAAAADLPAQQTEEEEPLDDGEEELLDTPVQRVEEPLDEEPLDVELDPDDEQLDAPVDEGPDDDSIALEEPLDVPLAGEVIDQPVAESEPLDTDLGDNTTILVPPVETPVATTGTTTAPVAASAPLPEHEKPVTSVRKKGEPVISVKKGEPERQVVVTAGGGPIPAEIQDCDVVVTAGRGTVGSDCPEDDTIVAHRPTITRQPGSSVLITDDNPSVVTSHRGTAQIGTYPEPTLGDSIATTVRAAIFPEDVVVPDVLIVPGEVVAAGNASAEDPIILWRSELEQAAAETGVPVEILATAIRATSNGDRDAKSEHGGVGLMHVPIAELEARGLDTSQWYDPATNIMIGAQLMADGASPADVQSGAALTNYLAESCGAGDACVMPEASELGQWIVHYRLRATTNGDESQQAVVAQSQPAGWPFEEEDDHGENGPFAALKSRGDSEDERDRPAVRVGGNEDVDRPPATRVRVGSD